MKIYKYNDNDDFIILHFGLGLVGKAIRDSIDSGFNIEEVNIQFDWDEIEKLDYLNNVISQIESTIDIKNRNTRLVVLWSAGKIGFSSTSLEVKKEVGIFNSICEKLGFMLLKYFLKERIFFILISSAGGLFEGQLSVNIRNIEPIALRPYSDAKMMQEQIIIESPFYINYEIMRLSSVYSIDNFTSRIGLIPTLMQNGLKNRTSSIYGNINTIRDYILDRDIANYVVKVIKGKKVEGEVSFLVSGKPTTIFELKTNIEKIMMRKLYMNFSMKNHNSSNISFNKRMKPRMLYISEMSTNLKKMYLNILSD